MKRSHSSETNEPGKESPNVNQIWNHGTVPTLFSLTAPVSPPRKKSTPRENNSSKDNGAFSLSLAAVEAGQVEVDDPVELFSNRLNTVSRPLSASGTDARLSIEDWVGLYARNQHENGHHFVIHQHDHPIAGPHYDLRLQFSDSSSLSWAIMYGLPGDPNSRRINRNATETRVHCLWVSIETLRDRGIHAHALHRII
jgi:DNA polymerase Ligase (LigD)